MSEQRASRVSEIRSFVADVMRELAVRPPGRADESAEQPVLDDPVEPVIRPGPGARRGAPRASTAR